MRITLRRSPAKERRLVYDRFEAGFGQTIEDNSIHTQNNSSAWDHGVGGAARISRHIVSFGNNVGATITGKQREAAYKGPLGATRRSVMDVIATPLHLITEKNRIGTLVNGVTSGFDAVANLTVVDPLTIAAGDHANTPIKRPKHPQVSANN